MAILLKQKIESFLSRDNNALWCIFVLFALAVFSKCVLFHWTCFYQLKLYDWQFYVPKLAPALTVACLLFVTKNKWWTILFCVLLDVWVLSNLVYYRANEIFLSVDAIMMANNMHGFWASVGTYFQPSYFLFVVITLVYSAGLLWIQPYARKRERMPGMFLLIFAIGLVLNVLSHRYEYYWLPTKDKISEEDLSFFEKQMGANKHYREPYRTWKIFIPLRMVYLYSVSPPSFDWVPSYIKNQSIVQYAVAACVHEVFLPKHIRADEITGTENLVSAYAGAELRPASNLIVIIFESLESWVFENEALQIAPNLSRLIHGSNVLYCDKCKSQVRAGTSGDGQMTINTGLLATQIGAACVVFDDNVYPNYAHLYDSTYVLNPCSSSWNQKKATRNYGYKRLVQREDAAWEDDARTFAKLDSVLSARPESFCVMAITIASHSPFKIKPVRDDYRSLSTPNYIKQYMSCVHYTDSCIGDLVDKIQNEPYFQNATMVITGDHTIFKPAMLADFRNESPDVRLPEQSFVPLLVYSPYIHENVHIADTCYQMDIYPTIMHLIGCEDYYWKGVGVNLLDSAARSNRRLAETDAFDLSDKLIRSNYFATIKQ